MGRVGGRKGWQAGDAIVLRGQGVKRAGDGSQPRLLTPPPPDAPAAVQQVGLLGE